LQFYPWILLCGRVCFVTQAIQPSPMSSIYCNKYLSSIFTINSIMFHIVPHAWLCQVGERLFFSFGIVLVDRTLIHRLSECYVKEIPQC
jgi:hypothetical protein